MLVILFSRVVYLRVFVFSEILQRNGLVVEMFELFGYCSDFTKDRYSIIIIGKLGQFLIIKKKLLKNSIVFSKTLLSTVCLLFDHDMKIQPCRSIFFFFFFLEKLLVKTNFMVVQKLEPSFSLLRRKIEN